MKAIVNNQKCERLIQSQQTQDELARRLLLDILDGLACDLNTQIKNQDDVPGFFNIGNVKPAGQLNLY